MTIRRVLFLVALCAITAAMGYVILGRPEADPVRILVRDFQTLIAGLLAVLAAWWTVEAMAATDKAAQRRHEQLLRIQTRPDVLTVERFMSVAFPAVDKALGELETIKIGEGLDIAALQDQHLQSVESIEEILGGSRNWGLQAEWLECQRLFSGAAASDWGKFQAAAVDTAMYAAIARTFSLVTTRVNSLRMYEQVPKTAEERAEGEKAAELLPLHLNRAVAALRSFHANLLCMARIYGIPDITE